MARVLLYLSLLALPGCQPLALSLLGAGAGTALRYTIDGVTSRTFTASEPAVKESMLAALERMGMTVDPTVERYEHGEIITARTATRTIEIEVEPISERATRVRIAAKNGGWLYDSATATEIVAQTDRLLDSAARGATAATTAPAAPATAPAANGITPSAITPVVAPVAPGTGVSAN